MSFNRLNINKSVLKISNETISSYHIDMIFSVVINVSIFSSIFVRTIYCNRIRFKEDFHCRWLDISNTITGSHTAVPMAAKRRR